MAFVRQKNVKGYRYYQQVRNYREQGKHRQEVIKHLGPHDSLEGAILATKRALGSILERQAYWVDRSERAADIALKSAKRDYHFSGESVELLGAAEARARLQELDEQYEEAARQAGYRWKEAWDRVYGSREAELDLIQESLAYHEAKDNAEYYGEHYEAARQVWLDPLLELMDKYSQPIRSQETRDLLQEWRERNT